MIPPRNLFPEPLKALLFLAAAATPALADVPNNIPHQGRVTVNGTNFDGTGQFKFLLFSDNDGNQSSGNETAIWSNQTTNPGSMAAPTTSESLAVDGGLYATLLGGSGMAALPTSIDPGVGNTLYLRTWFNDGTLGFEQLSPDAPFGAVPFALLSAQSISGLTSHLDGGGYDITNLGNLELGVAGDSGDFILYDSGGLTEMFLGANDYSSGPFFALYGEGVDLGSSTASDRTFELVGDEAGGGSRITMRNGSGTQTVEIDASEDSGDAALRLWSSANKATVILDAAEDTGDAVFSLYDSSGANAAFTVDTHQGTEGGAVAVLRDHNNISTIVLDSRDDEGGGFISLRDRTGNTSIHIDGDEGTVGGASITLEDRNDDSSLFLDADSGTDGGAVISLRDRNNTSDSIRIDSDEGNGGGSFITMKNSAAKQTIELDTDESDHAAIRLWNAGDTAAEVEILSDSGGNSRIVVDVLELRGADLSENFDIRHHHADEEIKPGMVVSIDPENPGELKVTGDPYDSKVAGIVSGADGVRPGILMGQPDTIADGAHAVAMTGRVWVDASAENGPITPGDLLTSSSLPGHAMKARDPERSFGSVIGKAMTALAEGEGRVLVLVNLQ